MTCIRDTLGRFMIGGSHPKKGTRKIVFCCNCGKRLGDSSCYTTVTFLCQTCFFKNLTKNKKGRTPNVKCEICGKEKYLSPYKIKKRKHIHCETCHSEINKRHPELYQKMTESQKENPNFLGKKHSIKARNKMSLSKGGSGDIFNPYNIQELRHRGEYKMWRLAVFKRDGFMCQCCHKIGKKLNAHHIKRFSKNINGRFDVNNGITLCVDCHKEVHKK